MADRQTKVTLSAQVEQYKKGMSEAARATRDAGTAAEKLGQQRQAFEQLGRSSLIAGAAIGAGVGLAVAKFADFDEAISQVKAVTQETTGNMEMLREAALDAGGTTVYTATEAANAIEELGKAGISTSDILGGALSGSLSLAASDNLEVARAAEITATTLKQFNLAGSEAGHVADVLAAGAGKALGGVEDLAQGLKFVGPVAASMGVSLEEVTGALSLFADQGLVGEQAGTSLRGVLASLTSPSSEAAKEIERLGITLYDSRGKFLGLENTAGQLSKAYSGLDDASRDASLGMIFGNQQVTAARVLFGKGAEGVAEYTAAVDDAGYAARVAADRLDNLNGDVEKLGGAFDTALIKSGAAANDVLRYLTQAATGGVDAFNQMPAPLQGAALGLGAVTSAALLGGGAFFTLVPKVAEFNANLATMGPGAQRAGRALSAFGKGAGVAAALATAVTLATTALIDYSRSARGTDEAVAKATTTNRGFLKSMEDLGVATDASAESVVRALDAIGSGNTLGPVGGDVLTLRDALTELDTGLEALPLENATAKFRAWGDELGLSKAQVATMLKELPGLEGAVRDYLTSTGKAADEQAVLNYVMKGSKNPTEDAAAAVQELAAQADTAASNLSDMHDSLTDIASTALGMGDAVDAAQGAINDLAAAAGATDSEGNLTASLNGSNDASIALRDSMRDVEKSSRDAAAAIIENGGSHEDALKQWNAGRESIINQRMAMGESREEAILWADQNLGSSAEVEQALRGVKTAVEQIPEKKVIQLVADTAAARTDVEDFIFAYDGRRINLYVDGYAGRQVAGSDVVARANGGIEAYANGGFPEGIYRGRPGGIHKFAEPETGWEAYISGKPGARDRNIGLWVEAGRRLGVGQGASGAMSFPDTITLVDADGSILTQARVIAGQAVTSASRSNTLRMQAGRGV